MKRIKLYFAVIAIILITAVSGCTTAKHCPEAYGRYDAHQIKQR